MDFSAFDTAQMDEYAAQAKAQWQHTPAYQEYAKKSKGRSKEAAAALARLDELWQADQVYLHIVVTHGDINNAETLLRRAVLLCQADSEELRPTLAELRACLGMVAETQQISIKNIL